MKNLQELKQERASKIAEQENLATLARTEKRQMTDEENSSFDSIQSEVERLNAAINRAQILEDNAKAAARNAEPVGGSKKEERVQPFSFIRAINNAKKNTPHTGEEKRALEEGLREIRTRGLDIPEGIGVAIPSDMLVASRDISVTGDSGTKGGKLVATVPQTVMPLLPSLKLEDMGASVMTGLKGNLKLLSGDEFTFDYVAEGAEVSPTDTVVDGVDLKPRRLSGVVDISNQWLIQTTPAAEAHVKMLIANGIQNAITKNFINGAGGVAPNGLYNAITTNVQAGAAAAPTWENVVGLETAIKSANATEAHLHYLSDAPLMGKLKTTKKDGGSGIFLSENGMLNGRKHVASSSVPTLDGGSSHPLIYGDFGQVTIGFWSGVSFIVDPLTQAAKGKTRLIFNIYNDVAVANEKAFAIRKNFTV